MPCHRIVCPHQRNHRSRSFIQPSNPSQFFANFDQRIPQLLRRLEACFAFLRQQLQNHLLQLSRNRFIPVTHRLRIVAEQLHKHQRTRRPSERNLSRRHLIQHNSQREKIPPIIQRLPARLLRSHVRQRSHRRSSQRQVELSRLPAAT